MYDVHDWIPYVLVKKIGTTSSRDTQVGVIFPTEADIPADYIMAGRNKWTLENTYSEQRGTYPGNGFTVEHYAVFKTFIAKEKKPAPATTRIELTSTALEAQGFQDDDMGCWDED